MDEATTNSGRMTLHVRSARPDDARVGDNLLPVLRPPLAPFASPRLQTFHPDAALDMTTWSVELDGRLVGLATLRHVDQAIASLHELQVELSEQTTRVTERLLNAVAEHCWRFGYLKLLVRTDDVEHAAVLLGRAGLRYAGRRHKADRSAVEFYIDLYRQGSMPRRLSPAVAEGGPALSDPHDAPTARRVPVHLSAASMRMRTPGPPRRR